MEITILSAIFPLLVLLLLLRHVITKNAKYRLPPSPSPPLPIIGHLHLLKQPLHRTLRRISETHGPIFSLKLGTRRVVVVSSPELVEECFTKNDVVLANRPRSLVNEYIGYNYTTVAGEPYGHRWRNLRRLAATEVLSAARLNDFSQIRQDEVRRTLKTLIYRDENVKLVLKPKLFELIFNLIMRMLTGKRCCDGGDGGDLLGERFMERLNVVFEFAASANPEEFFPFLLWIDYRGLKKKLAKLGEDLDEYYQGLLEEHRRERRRNSIIGHLLALQESDPDFYTDQTIKGFIANMIFAGTDTFLVTIEWAMSLLLNHPNVLKKAKHELDSQVGHHRLVEEHDLPNLHYLHNIIQETFRMFPAGPLLVPRASSADCKIGGYDIPSGTMLFVNAWSIHRDPKVWDDPESFKPERFEGRDVKTQELMPFGMGRRSCPGSGLGQRMVGLVLGSLIQCFDWERVGSEEIDLAEGVGLTMPKLEPLEAMCRPRDVMVKVLQELGD